MFQPFLVVIYSVFCEVLDVFHVAFIWSELFPAWLSVFVLQVSKKYVSKELAKEIHAKAAPFLKWLKEAEEESEGSEEEEVEDDENVEVTSGCWIFYATESWHTTATYLKGFLHWNLIYTSVLRAVLQSVHF